MELFTMAVIGLVIWIAYGMGKEMQKSEMQNQIAKGQDLKRYTALSDLEKLIEKIEKNNDVPEIGRAHV